MCGRDQNTYYHRWIFSRHTQADKDTCQKIRPKIIASDDFSGLPGDKHDNKELPVRPSV